MGQVIQIDEARIHDPMAAMFPALEIRSQGVKPKDTTMLRDDSSNGPGRRHAPRNVLGEPLEACSINP